ncbi:hypothetical protein [Mycobacteroides abscessus]|uniref:hypothetical protein n=1 Tax=Mycobacteroides abscessus TaxID=36809 RepID=UPI00092612BA|nr:hypothetical protein [Mycobacteroides abscessus]SHO82633.1 Uncharacterised protein [Mycobacteroides abscessus subsp. abscessus]SHP25597.1 Uncharacterised protein [Mycobacteroides abscessus subsp. abscessus]SHP72188.1 Uncharacterised protein [Mycobacteroides abscessus subsp. abscessus]SHQ92207.1 Uncharacterised protein [Mycobacteroides abscessus subsp. abscessus]SHR00075.1 Uncharacterised protein [Mycobacteroides abscessus subsp. abscessus]
MEFKRIGAALAVAVGVAFPLAACGSRPAPSVTTVTTPTYPTYSSPCPLGDGFDRCIDTRRAERQAADAARPSARPSSNPAQSKHDGGGLPWWAWALILPGGAIGLLVLGFKALAWNDERTISRAQTRVAELESRPRPVVDYDDYEDDDDDYEDDDEDDELDEEDMSFLHRVTDPAPAPAPSAPPAAGNLLSSLRQQNQ